MVCRIRKREVITTPEQVLGIRDRGRTAFGGGGETLVYGGKTEIRNGGKTCRAKEHGRRVARWRGRKPRTKGPEEGTLWEQKHYSTPLG